MCDILGHGTEVVLYLAILSWIIICIPNFCQIVHLFFLLQVWAVLKPGFLALLKEPFDAKPLDIIVFDVLPASDGNGEGRVSLATEVKERNPLRHSFKVRYPSLPYL